MRYIIAFLLIFNTVYAQEIVSRSPALQLHLLDNGRQMIGYYDGSSTAGDGWDSVAYLTGRVIRCNMSKIAQYDMYNAPIAVTGTATVNCSSLITDINVTCSNANITITINPKYDKQVINIKRMDNTNYTVTLQMQSGTIEEASTFVMPTVQNINTQLRWDSSINKTSIR